MALVNLINPDLLWTVGSVIILGIICLVIAVIKLLGEAMISLNVIEGHME